MRFRYANTRPTLNLASALRLSALVYPLRKKKWQRRLVQSVRVAVGLALVLVAAQVLLLGAARFPIESVQVRGNLVYVSQADIEDALLPLSGTNFFQAPVKLVEQALVDIAWIDQVTLTRVWPNQIQILVSELLPVAIWEDAFLISSRGDLVAWDKDELDQSWLPKLYGQTQQLDWILENQALLSELLAPSQLSVLSVELTHYQHWHLLVRDLPTALELEIWVDDQDMQGKLLEFLRIWPQLLVEDGRQPQRVDLRYPHGIAVKWSESAMVRSETDMFGQSQ